MGEGEFASSSLCGSIHLIVVVAVGFAEDEEDL